LNFVFLSGKTVARSCRRCAPSEYWIRCNTDTHGKALFLVRRQETSREQRTRRSAHQESHRGTERVQWPVASNNGKRLLREHFRNWFPRKFLNLIENAIEEISGFPSVHSCWNYRPFVSTKSHYSLNKDGQLHQLASHATVSRKFFRINVLPIYRHVIPRKRNFRA
jgi:hypothetical protein